MKWVNAVVSAIITLITITRIVTKISVTLHISILIIVSGLEVTRITFLIITVQVTLISTAITFALPFTSTGKLM